MDFEKVFIIDKQLMARVIGMLKTVRPDSYDGMLALCLSVNTLELAMNPPAPAEPERKEEQPDA